MDCITSGSQSESAVLVNSYKAGTKRIGTTARGRAERGSLKSPSVDVEKSLECKSEKKGYDGFVIRMFLMMTPHQPHQQSRVSILNLALQSTANQCSLLLHFGSSLVCLNIIPF